MREYYNLHTYTELYFIKLQDVFLGGNYVCLRFLSVICYNLQVVAIHLSGAPLSTRRLVFIADYVCVCFATKHDVLFTEAMRLYAGSAHI